MIFDLYTKQLLQMAVTSISVKFVIFLTKRWSCWISTRTQSHISGMRLWLRGWSRKSFLVRSVARISTG